MNLLECVSEIRQSLAEACCEPCRKKKGKCKAMEDMGAPVASTQSKVPSKKSDSPAVRREPEDFVKDYLKKLEPKGKKADKTEEKWIQKAIKRPGALHKKLGVPQGKKIPASALDKASHASGTLGREARLAKTLKRLSKHKK